MRAAFTSSVGHEDRLGEYRVVANAVHAERVVYASPSVIM
jgi:hypothetical protein